jgi:hypothetical protein
MPGNFNSGRRRRGAGRCESWHSIPLSYLRRKKLLKPYGYASLSWTNRGQTTGSIGIYMQPDHLMLRYAIRGEPIEQRINYTDTPSRFNGRRQWLQCPRCFRRCAVLYGGHRFYCRRCWGLTYSSQYQEPWERQCGIAERIRSKLGGKGFICAGDPFMPPPKPKWMRWRTYNTLVERGEALCEAYARGFEIRCARLLNPDPTLRGML